MSSAMKTLIVTTNGFVLACVTILLIVLGLQAAQASDVTQTPVQVVAELISAMEVNDADRIRAVFADDATQEYERWYARKKTGDKFRAWLESDIIKMHGRVINPKLEAVSNKVVVTGTYVNNDNYRSAADFLLVVEKGKIVSWTMRYD